LERQIEKLKDDVQHTLSEVQNKNESQQGFTTDNINMIKKTIKLEYDEKINDILQKNEQKLEDKDREYFKLEEETIKLKQIIEELDNKNKLLIKQLDDNNNSVKSQSQVEDKLRQTIKELNLTITNKDQMISNKNKEMNE